LGFKDGDFLLVEYTAKVKETGEIVETTNADKAKEAGIFDESREYGPTLVILGEGRVVKGFEEKLRGLDVGEEASFEVPPEKAYGKRDPAKLRRLPLREFRRANIEPVPGKVVEINGVLAVVRDVSGGRVTVDFNHPLAGKTVVYDVRIVKHVVDDDEKVRLLLKRRFRPKSLDSYKLSLDRENGLVEVEVPADEMTLHNIQAAKKAFARDVFRFLNWASKVVFKEVLVSEEKTGSGKEGAEKASEKEAN